jgi:hypothetical protein
MLELTQQRRAIKYPQRAYSASQRPKDTLCGMVNSDHDYQIKLRRLFS